MSQIDGGPSGPTPDSHEFTARELARIFDRGEPLQIMDFSIFDPLIIRIGGWSFGTVMTP